MTRLEELLDAKKKKNTVRRKMGNQKKVWRKSVLEKATIFLEGDNE